MRKTKLLNMYCKNKTHCLMEEYLTDPMMTWGNKQLILQLKQGISHITWKGKVARLRKLEKLYHNEVDPKCQLCGKEDEDVYHILFECIHYKEERLKYVSCSEFSMSKNESIREGYLK